MKLVALALLCLCLASGFLNLGSWRDVQSLRRERDDAKAAEQIALARYAEAATQIRRDTIRVTKWATRYDTLRDTIRQLLATDSATGAVPILGSLVPILGSALEAADSAVAACRSLVTSCEQFRRVADSTLAAKDRTIAALKPTWRDRCGVSLGVGLLAQRGAVQAGPTLSVGCKLW